jgi:hypothetical protein
MQDRLEASATAYGSVDQAVGDALNAQLSSV